MFKNEQLEALIKENPECLGRFNENHKDVLIDLRIRFQTLIAIDSIESMIERFLLCRALLETVDIQKQVAMECLDRKINEQGSNVVRLKSKTKH